MQELIYGVGCGVLHGQPIPFDALCGSCDLLSTRLVSSHPVRWVEGRVKESHPRKGKLLNLWTRNLIVRFAIMKNPAKSKWTRVEMWGKCIVVFALNLFKRLQAFYLNQLTYIMIGLTPVKRLIDNGWLQKQDQN
ncbi:hypothetical protein QTP88_002746 [Uroleucon formosanum]